MPRQAKEKDVFADLPEEFKDTIASMNEADIRKRVSEIALDEEENRKTKEDDEDLANLKEQVKLANEPYAERTKMNRLKIKFASRVLQDQGKI